MASVPRVRRPRTGRQLPSGAADQPGQPTREADDVQVPLGHGQVVGDQAPIRVVQPAAEGVRLGRVEPSKPEGPQLGPDGVGPDRHRPAVDGGLDRRVAEAFPPRRKHDGVAGRIGVLHSHRSLHGGHRSPMHPNPGPGQDALELVVVVLLGRAEQPVVGADGLGHREPGGHVFARDGPGRLEQQPLAVGDPEAAPGRHPIPGGRPGVKGVVDHRGLDTPGGQLVARAIVDGHVYPRRVIGWCRESGEPISLPGQVVVAQDGRSSGQGGGDRLPGGRIERE